jgi:hypothetical protein
MANLVGRKEHDYDFTDKGTGRRVVGSGLNIYYTDTSPDVEGVMTGKEFISESSSAYSSASSAKIGSTITFIYNRYGKVSDIMVAK